MLTLVETREDKLDEQQALETALKATWPNREKRVITWRPTSQ